MTTVVEKSVVVDVPVSVAYAQWTQFDIDQAAFIGAIDAHRHENTAAADCTHAVVEQFPQLAHDPAGNTLPDRTPQQLRRIDRHGRDELVPRGIHEAEPIQCVDRIDRSGIQSVIDHK